MQGRTVRLFLVDGSPSGILTAEIMNWTGHVLVAPRSQLPDALRRPEAVRTGVYVLTGDDPDHPSRLRVYIGEGDSVIDRLKMHAKDPTKDFWTHACLVTSKDANLTKAHVRYLESRLLDLAKVADRATIANGNEPGAKQLPESDVADMEFFLSQMQVVLPVVGLNFLRPKGRSAPQLASVVPSEQVFSSGTLALTLTNKKHGITANAIEDDGEIIVQAGSSAVAKEDFASNTYAQLRAALISDGRLALLPDGDRYVFTSDVPMASPSAAAAVVLNRNSNGRAEWRVAATGQSLRDWQDSLLAAVPQDRTDTV